MGSGMHSREARQVLCLACTCACFGAAQTSHPNSMHEEANATRATSTHLMGGGYT